MVKDAQAFSAKDRIDHSTYGLGTISEVNERHTTILFDDAGTKKFVTHLVKLVRSDTPAPVLVRRARKKKVAPPPPSAAVPPASGEDDPGKDGDRPS